MNVLEDGQAERLFPLLLEPPTLPESNVIPITMVRLPEPFAKLCVHRKCSYFVLPHETEKRAACYIQWPMFGFEEHMFANNGTRGSKKGPRGSNNDTKLVFGVSKLRLGTSNGAQDSPEEAQRKPRETPEEAREI